MPVLDLQVRNCLTLAPGPETEKFFLTAPVRWIDENDEGEMTALGVGSIDGQQRQAPVATLHSLLTRIATHQSQKAMQEADPLNSRPPLAYPREQVPILVNPPLTEKAAASISEPVSHTSAAPSISNQPANVQPAPQNDDPTSVQPAKQTDPTSMQHPPNSEMAKTTISDPPKESLMNGGPPEKLNMPEALPSVEPTKTEFITPPNDPEVNRQLQ